MTYLKLENHLTNWAVLFLLNLMSGKYIFKIAEDGYLTQKNINLALRKCIGVRVELVASPMLKPEKRRFDWSSIYVIQLNMLIS